MQGDEHPSLRPSPRACTRKRAPGRHARTHTRRHTYELVVVFVVVLLLAVLRVDLHGLVDEVDRLGGPRRRVLLLMLAERGLFGLALLQPGEVLQGELEQVPGLVPQHFHGKAL